VPERTDRAVGAQAPGRLPEAIDTAAGRLPRPSRVGGPTYLPAPPQGTSLARIRLDRRTGPEGHLSYGEVFEPSVAPFKRDLVFDQVLPDGTLAVSGRGLARLPEAFPRPQSGRELFWGRLRLVLFPGRRTPLPSVATDARILGWQTSPPLPVSLFRDDAGNWWVEAGESATVEVSFLMDAPSTYFAFPPGAGAVRDDQWRPGLDSDLQRRLEALWAPLGLDPTAPRSANVMLLVEHFRSFEPGEPPPAGADGLADLVLGRRGVCRHRSLGFVLMAQSLGIPSLYVMNEAHAFVEVRLPRRDGVGAWQRIDLGGGAESLSITTGEGRAGHRPVFGDPFPRPPSYVAGAAGGRPGGAASATWTGPGTQSAESRQRQAAASGARIAGARLPPGLAAAPAGGHDDRRPTRLLLERADSLVLAGDALAVAGRLQAPRGGRTAGLAVEVWLVQVSRPAGGQQIGTVPTAGSGEVLARVAIPAGLAPGDYDLVLHFAGNRDLAPATSSER
jgi:hypothetical protein